MNVYRSAGRIKTDVYEREGLKFCLVEDTFKGTLITEFNLDCEVVNQNYLQNHNVLHELSSYVGSLLEINDVGEYKQIEMKAKCTECGNVGLVRELDTHQAKSIVNIPVVPIFVCRKCGHKHYSLTDQYLKTLVANNKHLFEPSELEEINKDRYGSINTLKEYIIRIFASKRISRARIV